MKNFKELQEFLETATSLEKEQYLKSAPLLEKGLVAALDGDNTLIQEYAFLDMIDYVAFVQKFYHEQTAQILLFKSVFLLTVLLTERLHELVKTYNFFHNPTNQEIFQALSSVGVEWEVVYDVSQDQTLMHDSLQPFSYLFSVKVNKENEEIQLLASVLEFITLELFLQGDIFGMRIKPKEESQVAVKKQNWLDQINLILSNFNPEPAKYLGIALALGIGLLSATDAQAGSKDAQDYLKKVDQSLSQIEVPSGCKMGAKVLSTNGIGMTYEVMLGDYVVKTDFHKIGNISERSETTTYKLKEQKGCGLSAQDAQEMAAKISKNVKTLWAGK